VHLKCRIVPKLNGTTTQDTFLSRCDLFQDTDRWWPLVNMVINLRVL
jgi:hypothetical protein